jgi:hypothetical protein
VTFHNEDGKVTSYPQRNSEAFVGCGRHAGSPYSIRLDELLDFTEPYTGHGSAVHNRHEDWIRQIGQKGWRGDLALWHNPLWRQLWHEFAEGREYRIWSSEWQDQDDKDLWG